MSLQTIFILKMGTPRFRKVGELLKDIWLKCRDPNPTVKSGLSLFPGAFIEKSRV